MSPDVIGATCEACDGYRECDHCGGVGRISAPPDDSWSGGIYDCPDCDGSGDCSECHGTGEAA